jgi:hypothetical protein
MATVWPTPVAPASQVAFAPISGAPRESVAWTLRSRTTDSTMGRLASLLTRASSTLELSSGTKVPCQRTFERSEASAENARSVKASTSAEPDIGFRAEALHRMLDKPSR